MSKNITKLLCLISAFSLFSCSGESGNSSENTISFSIEATENNYYLDKDNQIQFSLTEDSYLGEYTQEYITYEIVGDNNIGANIWNGYFSADSVGSVTIIAKVGEYVSSNFIVINSKYSEEKVSLNFESLFNGKSGVHFGKTYDLGINKETAKNYTITGADDILKFNEEGHLEVCGIKGRSSKIQITNENNNVVFDDYFTTESSILCTKIRKNLQEKNLVNYDSDIPNNLLTNVKEIDLNGELVTILDDDDHAADGIRYLTELESLDLSNNDLTDISFMKDMTKLVQLNLSNNNIKEVSDYILENRNLEILDFSNNQLSDVTRLRNMDSIKKLDLSNNNITDISPIGKIYSLESLFFTGNNLSSFKDSISELENLKELGLGNCNILFSDIISLKYLNNLNYLDISGTDPNIETISKLSNLTSLVLSNCNLASKDLSKINSLVNLTELDLSENNLDKVMFANALNAESLADLKKLSLGGNAFIDEVPGLENFKNLTYLDMTNSYNLESISCFNNLKIETLILDYSNSISANNFIESLNTMPNLKELSILGGFNYINESIYNLLEEKVSSGIISLRLLTNQWVDENTIYNYSKSVYFSLSDFIENCTTKEENGSYTINYNDPNREIILAIINDKDTTVKNYYLFNIPSAIYQLDIYGNLYDSFVYNMGFNLLDRKEKSFTLELHDFKNACTRENSMITTKEGSKLFINAYGECSLTANNRKTSQVGAGGRGYDAINCYDLYISCLGNNSSIKIVGGKGENGKVTTFENPTGHNGGNGGNGITCNSCVLLTPSITIKGGNGGNGSDGHNHNIFWTARGHGGDGGNGGNGVAYKTSFANKYTSNSISGGSGGSGGKKGENALGSQGSPGSAGSKGAATIKR